MVTYSKFYILYISAACSFIGPISDHLLEGDPIIGQPCHALTRQYFGELINVTLAEDDAYSKLVDAVADVDVSDSLITVP